ncbi:MAG: hypothetical protein AAF702_05515 [Chloroflexota bacterium]
MQTQKIPVDWFIGETTFPSTAFGSSESGTSSVHGSVEGRHRTQRLGEFRANATLLRWLAIGFAICWVATAAPPNKEGLALEESRMGIAQTLRLDDAAWRTGNVESFVKQIDPNVGVEWSSAWQREWNLARHAPDSHRSVQDSQLLAAISIGDLMMVPVQVDRPIANAWHQSPYVENRFYRLNADKWQRTAPPETFWGRQKSLATANLRIDYVERDGQLIEPLMPELERLIVSIYTQAGIPLPPPQAKRHLIFVPSLQTKWEVTGYPIEIVSPTLLPIAVALTPQEAIIDTVSRRVIHRMMLESSYGFRPIWQVLTVGMENWLRVTVTDVPSLWHQRVVPLFWAEAEDHMPLELIDITDGRSLKLTSEERQLWKYMAAQTIIEYVHEVYGPEAPARLLHRFPAHRTWHALIEDTFGVSVQAWEAGWNEYLVTQIKEQEHP